LPARNPQRRRPARTIQSPVDRQIATQAMHGDLAGGLRQMEPGFEPLHGIGLFALLPAVVMVDTLARVGRDRDALALIERLFGGIWSRCAAFRWRMPGRRRVSRVK
jgi:hypothetical protein